MIGVFPPVPSRQPGEIGQNERILARQCAGGDVRAGVKLVQLLRAKGHDASLKRMLMLYPGELTAGVFDAFADALALADVTVRRRQELEAFRLRMRECGVEDQDTDMSVPQPESD